MESHTVNNSLLLSSTAALNSSSSVNIRLPKIELPTFDGDDTKWLTFRDRFVAMIDSSAEIPTIMKLQYLLELTTTVVNTAFSSVVNRHQPLHQYIAQISKQRRSANRVDRLTYSPVAKHPIAESAIVSKNRRYLPLPHPIPSDAALPFEHTSLTADNYAVTWTMLLKRYDNKRMLCREYYRRLHFLPSVEGNNVDELTSLVDEFTRHVNGLRKLEQPVDDWDVPLTNILFLKLDSESLLAWERHSSTSLQDKYSHLISFLQERIRILRSTLNLAKNKELGSITVAGKNHKSSAAVKGPASSPSYHRSAFHAATALREKPMHQTSCLLGCSDRHPLRMCPVFDRKLVKDRRDIVLKRRLCFNCLSAEHQAHACNSKYSCRFCNERHHTLLHVASSVSAPSSPTSSNSPAKITMSAQSADSQEQDTVLLETAIINIVDDHGQQIKARALLDSGSTSNFITESLAKRLQTPQTSAWTRQTVA
uniref:Peptidase aspartic putative domain-containing protein n=1 Tax=Anopheles funestus TaxID=62324 RepID=A0A182RUD4_ANOFN